MHSSFSMRTHLFLDEDAPFAETPPEFRQFMEGIFIYLFDPQQGCLRPSEITAAQQYLGAAPEGPLTYGSDPTLDMLYDGCGAGSLADCDMLFLGSEIGSEYEDYSLTCGSTTEPIDANITTCMLDQQDLSELSDLIAHCESGFYLACDVVYSTTLVGSADEPPRV